MPAEARAVRGSAYVRGLLAAGRARLVQTGAGRPLPEGACAAGGTPVLVAGVCGALSPALSTGDRVIPARVTSGVTGDRLPVHGGVWGTLVTVEEPVCDVVSRKQVRDRFQGDVVDMESYSIAAWCRTVGVPCCVARVVADTAHGPADASSLLRVNRDAAHQLTDFVEIVVKNIVENRLPGAGAGVVSDCTKNGAQM